MSDIIEKGRRVRPQAVFVVVGGMGGWHDCVLKEPLLYVNPIGLVPL